MVSSQRTDLKFVPRKGGGLESRSGINHFNNLRADKI